MKLRSYLFIASIVLFTGCGNGSDKSVIELQTRLDSTIQAHRTEIDLLQQQILAQESELDAMKVRSQLLVDSLAILKEAESKVGPQIHPKRHWGDPIRYPDK